MAIFEPKQWVNPFEKMSIFRILVKDIFLVYIAEKEKLKKWLFLDENHGLTPLEKSQFFDGLKFLLL